MFSSPNTNYTAMQTVALLAQIQIMYIYSCSIYLFFVSATATQHRKIMSFDTIKYVCIYNHTSSKNIFFIRLHSFWWKIHSSSLLFKFMKTNEDSSLIQKNEEWIFTPLHSYLVIFIFIPRHSSSFTLITPNHMI